MTLPHFLAKIIGWLRAGYPEGVPDHDYIPLFALLGTHLTDNEVTLIADELSFSSDPESATAIKKAISAVTNNHNACEADINRVRAHLAAGGWPLSDPPRNS